MPAIGHIVRLQVQRSTLKLASPAGAANERYYEPAALLEVAQLQLTADGVLGLLDGAEPVVDVHHVSHPSTKNANGANGMSVGFTSHYARMRGRFGPHLSDGIAGENVLVGFDEPVELDRLSNGLDIDTRAGGRAHLEQVIAAEPCVPFTRFALRLAMSEPGGVACTEGLRFLRHGTRGFYLTYAGEPVVLSLGDLVLASG